MKKFPLLRYFLAASLVAIASITVVSALLLSNRAQSDFVERSENQGAIEVGHTLQMFYYNMLAPQLENNPELAIEDAINPQMMDMFAHRTTFGLNVTGISVFDLAGNAVYSTDSEVASITESERQLFQQALLGTPGANLASGVDLANLDGERRALDAVHSYIAIRETAPDSGQEGPVLGVLSISQDVTDAFAAARADALRNAVAVSVGTGGVLFVVLLLIVFRADRVIATGYRQLRSDHEKLEREVSERKRAEGMLEEVNRSLEETVRLRTEELSVANEELRERNRQLLDARVQAATDGLTGLSNHRTFQERIRDAASHAQENGSTVGLIMLDIDDFKRVNDSQGHLAGDQILREIAQLIADVVKRDDTYRYGGDEFAVLLPSVDLRKTARTAERLRRAVEREIDGFSGKITVSLGVASFPDTAGSAEELIYGADAAMYWAKSVGKNQVGDWGKLLGRRADGSVPWYAADRAVKAPDVVAALVAALAAKDPITSAHTERCSWYTAKLAQELGLPEEETSVVQLSSLLHDIGKIAVPDEVLFKPGPLDEEEWAQMKQHPTAALHVLSQIHAITDVTPAILHHHEHFNGSGYPDGLASDDIPMASRILLVTDAFDAMTTDRPYRKAMPIETAIEELKRNSGSQFDPVVVEAFLKVLSRHRDQLPNVMATGEQGMETAAPGPRGH